MNSNLYNSDILARITIKEFDNTFHLILNKSLIGMECDYIKIHYRKFPQGSHIIL